MHANHIYIDLTNIRASTHNNKNNIVIIIVISLYQAVVAHTLNLSTGRQRQESKATLG